MNIALVRETLNRLLALENDERMPNFSGVCCELLVAANQESIVCINDCKEYNWANDMADNDYVDRPGYMTPIRREFIYKLLRELDTLES